MTTSIRRTAATMLAALSVTTSALAADGTWTSLSSGSWSDINNWNSGSGPIADGAGFTADFSTLDLTADIYVTNDMPRTIGNMMFADTTPNKWWYLPASSTLTLDVGGGVPEINVSNMTVVIRTDLAGSSGLLKSGAGTLELDSNTNTYSGGTILGEGSISVGTIGSGQFGTGAVTITNGSTLTLFRGNTTDNATYGALFTNELVIASGETGTVRNMPRGTWSGPLTGAGTFNLRVNATRGDFTGDWSAFSGQINVTARAGSADWRISNYDHVNFSQASIDLGSGVNLYMINHFYSSITMQIGTLSGAGNIRSGSDVPGRPGIFEVGARNEDSTYSGVISDSTGASALTKVGMGTLTLSGANTYSGNTTISAGTLALSGGGSIDNSPNITVADGATLDASAIAFYLGNATNQTLSGAGVVNGDIYLGTGYLCTLSLTGTNNGSLTTFGATALVSPGANAAATLTVTNDATFSNQSVFEVSLADVVTTGGGTNDLIHVGGNLSLAFGSGAVYVRPQFLSGTPALGQPYTIITYGGTLTGDTNNLVLDPTVFAYSHLVATFDTTNTPGEIKVTFAANPANIVWEGSSTNSWEASAVMNWLSGLDITNYYQFDNVTFNDSASNFVVALDGLLTPSAVTVNNSVNDYVFTNNLGGSISGGITLVKQGAGKLTLMQANTYTGGTTITDDGSVDIGSHSGALGYGSLSMNGAILRSSLPNNGDEFTNSINFGAGKTNVIVSSYSKNTIFTSLNGGGSDSVLQFQGLSVDISGTNNFVGTIELAGSSPSTVLRLRSEASTSTNVAWNLGNVGDRLSAFISGSSYLKLGALTGGASSTLNGYESGAANPGAVVTWEIGALGQTNTFAGKIKDGSLDTTTAIVKVGAGMLTLGGTNTYTGSTTVSNGTLRINVPYLSSATNVILSASGVLDLNFAGTNVVAGIVTNGVSLAVGVYNAGNLSPFITGPGSLQIPAAGPSGPAYLTNSVVGGTNLMLSWPAGQGWVLQWQTNALDVGLSTNWVDVPGSTGINSTNIPVDKTKPTVFYRLHYPGTSIPSTPTNVTFSVTGNVLTLSWPSNYRGWRLQCQTNSLNVGLSTNWVDVPGSTSVTETNFTIDPAIPAVFYRLAYP